ncbi:hypothetical protein HMPREF3187_01770 [Aerococcus christensenii]|uniref:Uncharacterized protein n=1 Tax=Aerococcus christensenii TaxID=87541 RepID=A0A133XQB7_9LACT|nr:hypothetical protein HMPREF3187_01770 [Aerococcus christensenii]
MAYGLSFFLLFLLRFTRIREGNKESVKVVSCCCISCVACYFSKLFHLL